MGPNTNFLSALQPIYSEHRSIEQQIQIQMNQTHTLVVLRMSAMSGHTRTYRTVASDYRFHEIMKISIYLV